MNTKQRALRLIGGLIVAGAAIGVTVSAASAETSSTSEAEATISALGAAASQNDRLPDGISYEVLGTGGLLPETVRFLGSDESASYRVGLDGTSQICIVVTLFDELKTTGSTCAPARVVEADGLLLGLQGNVSSGSREQVSYLLPDSADVAGIRGEWRLVGNNVAVAFAADVIDGGDISIGRDDGSERAITLHG